MQSSESEPLHRVGKFKKVHSSVENFEKTLKVQQKVLRDAFGWFCSVHLPNTYDARASAIIEPYHSETKQVTIILTGENVNPHSRFRSLIVRQKFNMSLKTNDLQETASAIRKSSDSIEFLNYYNTDDVHITIHQHQQQPSGKEAEYIKKSSFMNNLSRLSNHIQHFYVKNYLNWITEDNSTLVLAMSKQHGEVGCFFPTHYKNFEKCISRKINVVVKQEKLQIDVIEASPYDFAEVKRHEKLFDKNRKLRKFSKLQELLTPNYLKQQEKKVFEEEEFVVFSEESSSSEEDFYVFVDNVIETALDGDSITEDEFIVIEKKEPVMQFFNGTDSDFKDNDSSASEDSRTTEEDTVDSETEEDVTLKIEYNILNEPEEKEDQVDAKPKEDNAEDKDEVGENASNEEIKIEDNARGGITAELSDGESSDESETEELSLVYACNATNFLYFLYLFDKAHGTIYSKCKWKPVIHKTKIEGFHITIRSDFKAYIAYDGSPQRTNAFLEVHKELFKPKGTLLEKANLGMMKLKRKLRIRPFKSPFKSPFNIPSSSDVETEDGKATPTSKKRFGDRFVNGGKKLNFPFFGKKDDKKRISPKKNFKSEGNSSNTSLE